MQNKSGLRDLFDRNKSHSLQKVYDSHNSDKRSDSHIFEAPAFMFSRRDEVNQLRKVSLQTLNAFRPKLEARFYKSLGFTNNKGDKIKQPANERIK